MSRPDAPLDLSRPGRYHVVGVGGPGMSAIALTLAEMGHEVSGSDLRELPVLDRLRSAGVTVHVGHDAAQVAGVDAVTASSAIPATNVELVAAADDGVVVLRRAGMLASICAQADALAVAGTHGKTTTTSMLAMVLAEAGLDPSYVVGGDVQEVGTGAHWSGGRWLVVEADESDGTHLELPLAGTILTNVEADHLDHYGTLAAVVDGFDRYLAQVEGPKVLCADDPVTADLADRHDATTYGIDADARFRARDLGRVEGALRFVVDRDGAEMGEVVVPLRGRHNVLNALAVVAMAEAIGVPFATTARALARFGGVARRFDVRARHHGITLVDDYAHLPGEIAAVLAAAVGSGDGWTRLVAVFQPNRYNRMAVLSPAYADAFVDADVAVITDIYPSGQTPIPGVTGKLVVDAVCDAHPEQRVVWLPARQDLVTFLVGELRPGDVCVSMGCGDVSELPDEVLAGLVRKDGA
jgi:UDP-N-acetylmuramate--alanine ligase